MNVPTNEPARRDHGITFIELIVTIGVMGLIAAVVAAAVSVVFRTDQPVNAIIGESHDVQQAVNYFHFDVESGPRLKAEWDFASSAGSGCSTAGIENVMAYDVEDESGDPTRRIAYRLTTVVSVGHLDRFECSWNGASWDETGRVNIADRLDISGGPAVVVNAIEEPLNPLKIDRVTMEFAQSITDETFSATPRTESGLVDGPAPADCTDDPLAAALGFGVFVEGPTRILRGPVTGSLASGGFLSWEGDIEVATTDSNNIGGFTTVATYAGAGVDWGAIVDPLSKMSTLPGGANKNLVLGGTDYNVVPSGSIISVFEAGMTTGPYYETRGSLFAVTAYPIDFTLQAEELRRCADVIGVLPAGADADFVLPVDTGGNPYPGSGPLVLDFVGSNTRVLNLFETQLAAIPSVDKGSGTPLSTVKPLVVNVSEDPADADNDLVWDFAAASWSNVGDAKFVLYNFPNTTGTLTVEQDVYGTIFAPYADVITKGTVQGNVIAESWLHEGDAISGSIVENDTSKMFAGSIDWDD